MPFDPSIPAANTNLDAVPIRENFNALKALIDAAGPPKLAGVGRVSDKKSLPNRPINLYTLIASRQAGNRWRKQCRPPPRTRTAGLDQIKNASSFTFSRFVRAMYRARK